MLPFMRANGRRIFLFPDSATVLDKKTLVRLDGVVRRQAGRDEKKLRVEGQLNAKP